ncbi:MAG: helix-turn-helix domain-containing protein [Clostridiales bacterium]|nr:helix-turn-helix domain-containing protein [Clostridiales bacterium]
MEIDIKVTYRNDKLKAMREAAGFSQSQFATATGITVKNVQNYEQGKRDLNGAKLATILKFCATLSCRMEDVLTDPDTLDLLAAYEVAERNG